MTITKNTDPAEIHRKAEGSPAFQIRIGEKISVNNAAIINFLIILQKRLINFLDCISSKRFEMGEL